MYTFEIIERVQVRCCYGFASLLLICLYVNLFGWVACARVFLVHFVIIVRLTRHSRGQDQTIWLTFRSVNVGKIIISVVSQVSKGGMSGQWGLKESEKEK